MNPDRSAADRLNDYLDAVVTGEPIRPHDLDASLAATVEHFFAADNTPGPTPGLTDHVWEEVMNQHSATVAHVSGSPLTPGRNGQTTLSTRPALPSHHGPSLIAYFATAALLLLTFVAGFVALRGWPQLMSSEQQSLVIPAIDSTPERVMIPDTNTNDIVLRATLETLGEMPASRAQHELALGRHQLALGAVQPVGKQENTGVGLNLFTVEVGQVTVEADAPVLVTRADADLASTPDSMPPGTDIVLEEGDQLYAPSGVSFVRRNDGSDPAILLDLSLSSVGDMYFNQTVPAGVTSDAGFPFELIKTFPVVPAEATVHRWTLAPGAELPVRDVPGLELLYVEAGDLDLVFDKGGTLNTPERTRTLSAGNGTDVFGRTPERAVLANRGTEPLVLLTASITPSSTAGATTETP